MRIIDRYVIRQVLSPFCIGLLVFTFILIIPEMRRYAEIFIAKGVPTATVVRLMATLVPMALGLSIPMSLLLGLLVAFGRLSADREFVAMQACGVSLIRLLRPVAAVTVVAWAATSYVLLVAVPEGNQTFRDITFGIIAERAEGEVKPRVFFEDFPDVVLYVREVPRSGGGWNGVFLEDHRGGEAAAVYLADRGRVVIDRGKRTVEMVLDHVTRHKGDSVGTYEVSRFDRLVLSLDPETVFPRGGVSKGTREMSIPELRQRAAELAKAGTFPHNELFEIHKKFSIPFACVVFGLIGLALGASNRRDGKLASFVLGLGVIFAYYVLLYIGQSLIKGRMMSPWLAAWLPNIVLGVFGLAFFRWRDRVADRPIRISLPGPLQQAVRAWGITGRRLTAAWLPLGILDRYVALSYLRVFGLSAAAMAGLFYITTFLDRSEKVLKGDATWAMLGALMWNYTPQYVYYIIPLSVLLATLVTVGLLTKNSELVVMKACGISLYRVAFPMLVGALLAGAVLFAIEQTVLGPANRRAEQLRHVMNGGSIETFDVFNRRWMLGRDGDIYHYNYFDPRKRRFMGLTVFRFADAMGRITQRSYAEYATYLGSGKGRPADAWQVEKGWTREFDREGQSRSYMPFALSETRLEPADYFVTETPDPEFMSYTQLRRYVQRLQASGFDVIEQQVALARKISFPFVTLVMTLLAVPFAVTIGRSGTMAGIGIAVALAVTYWTANSVFAAMGIGGLIAPALAAWAPNLLFAAGATFLLLTVRT